MKISISKTSTESGKVVLVLLVAVAVVFGLYFFLADQKQDSSVGQQAKVTEDKIAPAEVKRVDSGKPSNILPDTEVAKPSTDSATDKTDNKLDYTVKYFEALPTTIVNVEEAAKNEVLEDFENSKPVHAPLPTRLPESETEKFSEEGQAPESYKPQARPKYGYSARETPVSIASSLIGDMQGINPGSGGTPPDTHGAVGPNHIFTVTNGQFRVTARDTGATTTISKSTLFPGIGDLFDPRTVFDPQTNRYYATMAANRRSASSGMALAVSTTDDPTGTWRSWLLDFDEADGYWADFPSLGYSSDKITVSFNSFSNSGDSFEGQRVFVINKNSAIGSGSLSYSRMKLTGVGGSLMVAQTHDATITTQYLARTGTANFFGSGRAQAYKLTGTVSNPNFAALNNNTFGSPWSIALPDAPQLGTTAKIQTNDDRLANVAYRNGSIWIAHTVGMNTTIRDRAAVKWWEINAADGSLIQDGYVMDESTPDGASGVPNPTAMHYYYPSISVNKDGDVLIGFSGSSGSSYVSSYYTMRRAGDPLGYMDPPKLIKAGAGPVNTSRWGDYSATMVDPADDTTFWTVQEYGEVNNKYGVWWGHVGVDEDTTSPTLQGATATSSTNVRITFDEAMLNNAELRNASNYIFSGGRVSLTASAVTVVSATQVDVTVNQMTNAASYTVTVSTNITDLSGNALSSSSRVAGFSGAATALSVTSSSTAPSLTNVSPIPVTVSFSASVTGFTAGDLNLTNATAANFSGSGSSYSFNLVPSGQGTVSVSIPSGSATDGFNNLNGAGSILSRTYDSVKPVATFSSTESSPTSASPIPFTVSFSEVVSGFVVGDISVINGTTSNFQTVSAQSYSFDVTPSSDAIVTVSLPANRVADSASNTNNASSSYSRTYESAGGGTPVITSLSCSVGTYIATLPFTCNVAFSASVSNFAVGDISVTNGTATSFSGNAENYSFSVTGSSQGAVRVKINAGVATDSSANANEASVEKVTIYDSVRPIAALSSGTSNPTNSASIAVQVSLSEVVSSFNTSSLAVENATVSNFSGSGLNYSFTLTPSAQGVVRVEIPAGRLTDAAGNINSTNPSLSRTFDSVAPPAPEISVSN